MAVHSDVLIESIADQLYRVLRDRITSGYYTPGDRLDPQAVATEFGVSRTPVRDAIAHLDHDQLIETRPRSGTFVAKPGVRTYTKCARCERVSSGLPPVWQRLRCR